MKTKLCLPITKQSTQEILTMLRNNMDNFDMAEIYLDYIAEPISLIKNLINDVVKQYPNKIILVFRRIDKNQLQLTLEQRQIIINFCNDKKVYLDFDIYAQKEELHYINVNNLSISLITSFHDYKKTPRTSSLVKVIDEMSLYNPAVYKIATYCETPKDALHLMHLLLDLREQNKKTIVLGMGNNGKITRVFCALYGNEITYAPETMGEQSAQGQLTRSELEKIVSIL